MNWASPDLERVAAGLAARLPEPLGTLARIAVNYRWSWLPGAPELFERVDPDRWARCAQNPVRLLQEAPHSALQRAADDRQLVADAVDLEHAIATDLARPATGPVDPAHPIAFFCAEYAIHVSLPIYSGGLGALAGDLLKQASDQATPMVAVGLLYREGYFRQRIDASGWQHEYWVDTDPDRLPAARVTDPEGRPLTISVALRGTDVMAALWRVDVGRVPLLLLDTDVPENGPAARWITSRLYVSDPEVRLAQYALLGLGGVRALHALRIDPGVVHLNEGHAAFVALELTRGLMREGRSLEDALAAARELTVFTTHTPVPAGNDTYPIEQVAGVVGETAEALGFGIEGLARLGRSHPDQEAEPFGVTQFALRTCRSANAVSRRHGEVAREMWRELWPGRELADIPLTHVTNGVHLPSWMGGAMRGVLGRHLTPDWPARAAEAQTWAALEQVDAGELWAARNTMRGALIAYVRERSARDRLARGESASYALSAADALDPDTLTIGFARRVATYKRLGLLLAEDARSLQLLGGERPVQILLAGKAHPRDEEAKRLLQDFFARKSAPEVAQRVVFLDDYDLGAAARLVAGCDVWVNLPRPPMEASGTSGMKSIINGGLHLSVLDGWWAEAYDGTNGWALPGDVDHDHGAQDARDGAELFRLLADEIVPAFHDRDADGVPQAWMARVRASMRTLAPAFNAGRMLDGYLHSIYRPQPHPR